MPLFHRRSEEEKQQEALLAQRRDQEAADQVASIASLERGGIPVPAQRRLKEFAQQGGKFFTSDLSVSEFLLSRQVGIRPLSQVLGSSVYHVGYQYISSWNSSGELTTVSHALNEVRSLALGRLAEEAQLLGAHVVLGVRIVSTWISEKLVEFQAVGTAARVEGGLNAPALALTTLSGQDLWKLYSAGYRPVGVAAGSTAYHAVPGWGQWATSGFAGWYNQELPDFTRGLYSARHLAMGRVHQDAQRVGASGVVGVTIEQTEEEYEVQLGNDRERTDMIFTFHVIGTAIAELESAGAGQPVYGVVNLRS